ncbi:uncharacterized protein LOC132554861 [Ylistrum balloti]|uniref:uncharacterized protein LOC132554861 n=1 Tax=Ylistrum balloti TaxID=509963 RepID=UPI002905ECF3|nr:uncharacterized protein LOC132554861 [Ylistrum balloti]
MMNYVGSISILDRGDAPAQAIIDKNARSLAQRVADETRDELEKVMTRVDNIYESYEASTQALMETQSTLEYVEDIAELEALIKDQIKKKKYQQQVTIFIVGYENVCGQKLRLLQQVNEFFMDNSKSYEEEDWYPKTPDIDLDDCSSKIEESLTTAKELTEKISTINADMVEWLTTYAINKASTKALNMVDSKSKKKLESALSKAKDDVKAITDQLKSALLANDEKDDLIQTYLKQLEGKTLEAQKFKAAAEVAKKNVQGLEAKELVYQEELEKRTSAMKQLQEDLRKMQMDASQSKFLSELNSNRLKNKDSETAEYEALQEVKLDELQSVIERHRLELQESKRELEVLHQDQLKALHETHAADLEAMRGEYADMIKKLQDDLLEANSKVEETERLVADATDAADKARQDLLAIQLEGSAGDSRPTTEIESQPPEAEDDGVSRDSSRQKKKLQFDRAKSRSRSRESRPSTKDTRSSKGAPTKVTVTRTTPAAKTATKPSKPESKSPVKPVKETADASIQDEGGDPVSAHAETRQSKRARSTLETVKETDHGAEFEDSYDLADENSWALVPVETIPGRFAQYRKMTIRKLSELEEQLGLTVAKTQRKVTTLKSQFQEHKSKWETERKVLIEQVEQAQKLQTEAEKEADVAMTQLEEFINEQERLEEEEEVKRQEVVKGVSKPVMVSIPTQNDDDESEVVTSSSPKTLTPIQPGAETGAPPPTFVQSEESEHELTNLMQQTDDAKVQVMNARKSSGALSAPPAVEPESETRDKTRSSMSAPRSPPLSRSRGSVVSQYVTRGMTGTTPIEELSEVGSACTRKSRSRSAGSGSCKEWILHVTPRYQSRQGSTVSGHDIMDAFIVEDNLPKCQSSALNNMKSMMEEENMSSVQHRTLESVRSALKTLNEKDQELSDLQLERTITLISLASQLTEESIQLGVLPESVFDAFAEINSRAMSNMSHGEEEFLIDDTPGGELLRPMTQGSVLTEPSITETSSGSLKQLPPLESFLLSSQSRRLTGSRQRSLKMSSASLDNMSKYHDRPRADSNMTLQGPLMTFATMATGGTTRKSSPITPRPKSVTKMLSRSQLSRTKKTDMGLTFGSPEYFEYPGNEEGYLYHGIKVCDHGTSPIFQLILYDNGTSPMYQISDGTEGSILASGFAVVSLPPETVENSEHSNQSNINVSTQSENGKNSDDSEIFENEDNSDCFSTIGTVPLEDSDKTENLEMFKTIENNQSDSEGNDIDLENIRIPETLTAVVPKQGDSHTVEDLRNIQIVDDFKQLQGVVDDFDQSRGVVDNFDQSPEVVDDFDQSQGVVDDFDQSRGVVDDFDQSPEVVDDFDQSQGTNENQSKDVFESSSPNQPGQAINDACIFYQNDVDFENVNHTKSGDCEEKISQSGLKVSLPVSDVSTKVESKGSSATSRSEVNDSKFIKKVDISYPKDELVGEIDDEKNSNRGHGDVVEVKGQESDDGSQHKGSVSFLVNEIKNNPSEDIGNDALRIGLKVERYDPDVKSQRKVIRSKVKVSEVMTQQFDYSLYDLEKLKVTGLPLKKNDSTDLGDDSRLSSREPLKARLSESSDLPVTEKLVTIPEPSKLESDPVHFKKTDVHPIVNRVTSLKSHTRQMTDLKTRGDNSDNLIKTDNVQKFRPVQWLRESIDENSILNIDTTMQGIMGDFVTPPETQTQIVPKTEEEIRATSALSRASLRKEYRNKLGEVRAAVEDRRTKSPAISIPSQRSLEEDQLIDEDDDDEIPYNDIEDLKREQTMEMGTSPPPGQKSSSKLSPVNADHPIVTEYLRLYEGVVQFRNALSKLMVDRDMLQPSQILEDIDTKKFISSSKLEPQIEGMTHNVYHVFEEILAVLSNILLADREPMVSSLTGGGMMMSRDTTQAVVGPKSAESGRGPTVTRASHHSQFSAKSDVSDRIALRELQEQYDRLQHQLSSDTRKHEEQLRHNTVVMMEMQDTINDLQRELSNLGRSSSRLRPQSDTTSPHGTTDSAIMFTRLDSERNAKIMKRAVNDQKMNTEKYKDALVKMEDYVGLPAQRFAHLVRKYVHHSRMKEIEENVKKSKSLNENVFEILDKMEALQNERAKTWADKMDQMGSERIRLANLLMETLDSIEQESGIFLIKPMYSYRGRFKYLNAPLTIRDIKDARYGGKLTRPIRPQRNLSPNRENLTSFAPAPTPASNMRMIRGQPVPTTQSMTHETTVPKQEVPRPLEGDEGGISGASLNWVGTTQKQTWSMNSSVVRGDPENFLSSQNPNAMNTPRILELDINRMLIGQNTISSKMTQPGMTEDRLVNASQNNLRSYITVNRPTALPGNARPRSFASSATKEFVPPSSPVSQNTKRVRLSDGDMSRNMTNTPPLPPIGSASTRDIPGEPPRSPPGSSMRQSPPHVQEVISPLK